MLQRLMRVGAAVGAVMLGAGAGSLPAGAAHAASQEPVAELSPDSRPVLVLEPPSGALAIRRDREERRAPLPAVWRTSDKDRGFSQALLLQLSHSSANWPWRTLIVSNSGPERRNQLQKLVGQHAVVATVRDELVDLGGMVEFHVTVDLTTVRAIATIHETRAHTRVEYLAPPLAADSRTPRRSLAQFVMEGPLDDQVSAAAIDLSQFLTTIVGRVAVPGRLRPHNPTLGELGLHPTCGECRAWNTVVYQQPGRVWVRVGRPSVRILALPVEPARPGRRAAPGNHSAPMDRPQTGH